MKFVIKGPLPGLNELIEAERRHRQEGARLKKQCETVVMHAARQPSVRASTFSSPEISVICSYRLRSRIFGLISCK